ncbi:hypothetical protein ANN_27217 [Periplaneta americana]|uniref:Uncharacterized protein n=1 Tax=Periplaneta americana TaxID=6978 RepID=A0ABQ8RXE8_PERAM|nr:hypothetical protein ANN_27217 [Periplaneta americana]
MEAGKEEQRGAVGFLNAEGIRGREIHRRISAVYGEHSMSCSHVLEDTRNSERDACHCKTMLAQDRIIVSSLLLLLLRLIVLYRKIDESLWKNFVVWWE